jgi:dienelactone hydrolase
MNTLILAALSSALLLVSPAALAATRMVGSLPRAQERPPENLPKVDTELGELRTPDGARLRTFVTKPQGSTGRLPAVLFVQWLSCDTIEVSPNPKDGWSAMLRRLITESGWLWQRTEKSGVGDSQGIPCAKLDYETELAHHRAAFRQLRSRPDVDPARIVIYGGSMGSNYAPLVAAGEKVAGVVVWGGGATTWFERMLRFERNALELGDKGPESLTAEVNARAAYFSRYLLRGESPSAIAASDPELGKVWSRIVGTSSDGHYGRPFAFHQQAQRQDWAGAWARVNAPVLVLFGEYDWFESRDAAELIARIVNRQRPGTATFRQLPGTNHHFDRFPSAREAFAEKGGTTDAGPAVEAILQWLPK